MRRHFNRVLLNFNVIVKLNLMWVNFDPPNKDDILVIFVDKLRKKINLKSSFFFLCTATSRV